MRNSNISRKTNETDILVSMELDGKGNSNVDTRCGFLNHMLTLFAKHSGFDIIIKCTGDIDVDYHHSAEDIGICLGKTFKNSLGDMKGITRYGDIILPMDEALILCAVDISGRDYLNYDVECSTEKVGDFDVELVKEFLYGFVRNSNITLHIKKIHGENTHHILEGVFKALGRTLSKAVKLDEKNLNEIPSTKGVL